MYLNMRLLRLRIKEWEVAVVPPHRVKRVATRRGAVDSFSFME